MTHISEIYTPYVYSHCLHHIKSQTDCFHHEHEFARGAMFRIQWPPLTIGDHRSMVTIVYADHRHTRQIYSPYVYSHRLQHIKSRADFCKFPPGVRGKRYMPYRVAIRTSVLHTVCIDKGDRHTTVRIDTGDRHTTVCIDKGDRHRWQTQLCVYKNSTYCVYRQRWH